MKATVTLTVLVALALITTAPAHAESGISLDEIVWSWPYGPDTMLCTGTYVIFKFRVTNETDDYITGLVNGFQVYSPDGADWGSTHGEWLVDCGIWFDLYCGINEFGITGSGADTVSISGTKMFQPGIPPGFDSAAFLIGVGRIPDSEDGKTLCIDSCFYPPNGQWIWTDPFGGFSPAWGGPYCFQIGVIPGDDPDGDGAWEGCDNCPSMYNPNQDDSDYNGVGDVCQGYCCEIRGDIDHSGDPMVTISDLVYLVDFMFNDGPEPVCRDEADLDSNGSRDIADLVFLVDFMFNDGPAPPACP